MLTLREQVPLAGYTTLRLGGPAARFAEADTAGQIVAVIRDADLSGEPVLVLGGGSNLVVADEGFPGVVVRVASRGITASGAADRVRVTVAAGENWDDFVEWSVSEKLAGLECLAGIPGLAGATPVQNVGAYGQEVATVLETVRVLDRADATIRTLAAEACGFGYRTSLFKQTAFKQAAGNATGRYVVLEVTFLLDQDPMSAPIRYAELARHLDIAVGGRVALGEVRDAVLALRRGKGMVLDPGDPDTASAGSFFTNPVMDRARFAALADLASARWPGISVPCFPADGDLVKVPAGWLIEHAGFGKGYPGHGQARVSSKHSLALTNQGGASAAELIALARQIVAGVRAAFDVELTNEPVMVGVRL